PKLLLYQVVQLVYHAVHKRRKSRRMATEFATTAEVRAAPEAGWKMLAAPTRWPGWTTSIETVELLDGVFEQGARVRISQPRLRTAVWTVTEYRPGRGFTWRSSAPGVVTTGEH